MNRKLHRILIEALLAGAVLCTSMPTLAQIPVTDGASLAQQIQQVAAWQQQLQGMYQQYQQQLKQFQALTGARGFGDVLANPLLQRYLPLNLKQMYDGVATGNMSSVASAARQQAMIFDCLTIKDPVQQTLCNRQLNAPFAVKDMFTKAYEGAEATFESIEGLRKQINFTQDPKAIAELQARIQTEQANAQNALVKVQMAAKLAEIETKLVEQEKYERSLKNMSSTQLIQHTPTKFQFNK